MSKRKSEQKESTVLPKLGPVIAIDGPAGTGKSTVTHRLAEALGFVHVDTGALYRAVAFLNLEARGGGQDVISIAHKAHLEFRRDSTKNPSNRIFANGKDISEHIRTPQVTTESSRVSAIPEIRAALLGIQRRLGCQGKAILEGRDIGTVIFPDADVKFFLTASLDERVKRRLIELSAIGIDVPSFEELKRQMSTRDDDDSKRAVAPLKKASDAVEIDTTNLTLDQVIEKMKSIVQERLSKATKK